MNPDTLIWVCIPQRVDLADGATTLRLAVAVQPRLQSATLGAAGLATWPPASLAGARFRVDVGPSPNATQPFEGTVHADADAALWPLLFPPDTPVVPAADGPGDARALQIEPTASHARAARQVFEAAAAAPVLADDDGGAARTALHAAVRTALAASPFARADRGALGRARAAQPFAVQPPAAGVDPPVAADLPAALPRAATAAATPPPIVPDFHRTVALLREHPVVMRALGLVFDVVVPAPAALAGAGVVRVRWPDAPAGTPAIVSPWTAYELDVDARKFLPQSTPMVSAGMLAISDAADGGGVPAWSLATLDVDLAVDRLGQAADGAAHAAATVKAALPALRTGGIALLHSARADHLADRRARRDGQRALDPAAMVLHADDLVLGYRVDVRRGDGAWRSLCTRVATYTLGGGQPVGPAGALEEGNVKAHAAVDDGGPVLYGDEVVARWQGWSLAVAQPRFDAGAAAAPAPAPGRLAWTFAARGLPRLRFAAKYQLRVRIADLAGGGLGIDDPLADRCATGATIYERYEPVVAPAVALPDAASPAVLGPGESVEEVVLRSDRGVTPPEFAAANPHFPVSLGRTLEPPRVPLALAEQHAMLDHIPDPAASWEVVREAAAPADPTRPLPLPDPAAAGVAAFHISTLGAPRQLLTRAWPPWPGVGAKHVRLAAGRRGDPPAMQWNAAADGDELVVTLAPGHAVALEVSSTMQEGFPDQFAARQFLSDDAKLAAANGRHPLLTPARVVRVVHAVRGPLDDPAGAFRPARQPGDVYTTLVPVPATLGLDAPSTGRVDVTASWTQFDDDVQTAVAGVRVGGAALAPEGTAFDDPIRHEFGDTRHRVVTYTATAVGRHRHYFDPTGAADDALFTAAVSFPPVHVPSAAPPAAPVVLATVPAFLWTDEPNAPPPTGPGDGRHTILRRRRESLLRVVLDRPWFSSGEGEQLAVIFAAATPVAPDQRAIVTEIGRDPLWVTDVPVRWPGEDDLNWEPFGAVPTHVTASGADVLALPHDVWFSGGRWHADVKFALVPPSYSPFVRLAVARYQEHSVDGATLSPIVQAPFAPLLPDRRLTVDRAGDTLFVRLEGPAPDGPIRNNISAVLETCPATAPKDADLSARNDDAAALPVWRPVDPAADWTQHEQEFGQELVLALPAHPGPLRVVVRETEALTSGDTGQVLAPSELGRRVVFLDVVPIAT